MKFLLGTHETSWLGLADFPLFVSHRRLCKAAQVPPCRLRLGSRLPVASPNSTSTASGKPPSHYHAFAPSHYHAAGFFEWANDLNSCHYTPLKGVIRWIENVDDWRMLSRAYATAAAALAREFEGGMA